MIRLALFCALLIVIIGPIALYTFQIRELFEYLKTHLDCLFMWFILIGGLIVACCSKERRKQLGLIEGDNVSEKLKRQAIMPESLSSATIEDVKIIAKKRR